MASTTDRIYILSQAKLRPPIVAADVAERPRLIARLNRLAPLTLVVAPAGYGKTTLISMWLAQSGVPSAWVSLDDNDDEPTIFLMLVVNAVRTLFPQFGSTLLDLLSSPYGRPFDELALMFINQLDSLSDKFVLVLDDYHAINQPDIHKLVVELSAHPPQSMYLVITTRHDPFVPWHIRTSSNVCELRARDLSFSVQETTEFLKNVLEQPIEAEFAKGLTEQSEGWITSLRLAALYARQRQAVSTWQELMTGNRRNLVDYFASEVLAALPASVYNFLIHTSILDLLSGPLCDYVLAGSPEYGLGADLLRQLESEGVFVTSLEGDGMWYRCHSLFRQMLQLRFNEASTAEEIRLLYERASAWCEERDSLEEALHYALGYGTDVSYAVAFLGRHRAELLEMFDFRRLERWLKQFPPSVIPSHIDLLLAKGWITQARGELFELEEYVQQIEALLASAPPEAPAMSEWQSEVAALRSQLCVRTGEYEKAIQAGQQAIEWAPSQRFYVRGFGLLHTVFGLNMAGRAALAHQLLDTHAADPWIQRDLALLRSQQLRHFLQLATADIFAMRAQFPRLLRLATSRNYRTSLAWAHYFWGCACYLQNQLGDAEEHFRAVLDLMDYANGIAYTQSALGLALTRQAQGAPDDAQAVVTIAKNRLTEMQCPLLVQSVNAFAAELAVRQGRIGDGLRWLADDEPQLFSNATPLFFIGELVAPKVLLADGSSTSLAAAHVKLERVVQIATCTHNVHAQIQAAALQAALYEAEGDRAQALTALADALALAQPGGVVRIFVDFGSLFAPLLTVFAPDDSLAHFAAQVRNAIEHAQSNDLSTASGPARSNADFATASASPEANINPVQGAIELHNRLTYREIDVLRLLDLRLTNKEIGRRLGISSETVRQYTVNLFRKLQVENRRQAVVAARAAGFYNGNNQ